MPIETSSSPTINTGVSTPRKYGEITHQEITPKDKLDAVEKQIKWLEQEILGRKRAGIFSPKLEAELETLRGRDTTNLNIELKKHKDGGSGDDSDEIAQSNAILLDYERTVNASGPFGADYGAVLPRRHVPDKIHPPFSDNARTRAVALLGGTPVTGGKLILPPKEVIKEEITPEQKKAVVELIDDLVLELGPTIAPLTDEERKKIEDTSYQIIRSNPAILEGPTLNSQVELADQIGSALFAANEAQLSLYSTMYVFDKSSEIDLSTLSEDEVKAEQRFRAAAALNYINALLLFLPDYSVKKPLNPQYLLDNAWLSKHDVILGDTIQYLTDQLPLLPETTDAEREFKAQCKAMMEIGMRVGNSLDLEGVFEPAVSQTVDDDPVVVVVSTASTTGTPSSVAVAASSPVASTPPTSASVPTPAAAPVSTSAPVSAPSASAAVSAPAPAPANAAPASPEPATLKPKTKLELLQEQLSNSTKEEEEVLFGSEDIKEILESLQLPFGVSLEEIKDVTIRQDTLTIDLECKVFRGKGSIKAKFKNQGNRGLGIMLVGKPEVRMPSYALGAKGKAEATLRGINNSIGVLMEDRIDPEWNVQGFSIEGEQIKFIFKKNITPPSVTPDATVATPAPATPDATVARPSAVVTPPSAPVRSTLAPTTPMADPAEARPAIPDFSDPLADPEEPEVDPVRAATAVAHGDDETRDPISATPSTSRRSRRFGWPGRRLTTSLLLGGALVGTALWAAQPESSTPPTNSSVVRDGGSRPGTPGVAERISSPVALDKLDFEKVRSLALGKPDKSSLSYFKRLFKLEPNTEITYEDNQNKTHKTKPADFISAKTFALRLLVENHPDFKDIKVTDETDLFGDSDEAKKYREIYNKATSEKQMEYDYAQRIYYQHLAEINRAIALPLPGVTGVSERVVLLRRVDANGAIMAIKIPEDNATFIKNIKTLASEDYKALTQKGEIWKGFADESYR